MRGPQTEIADSRGAELRDMIEFSGIRSYPGNPAFSLENNRLRDPLRLSTI